MKFRNSRLLSVRRQRCRGKNSYDASNLILGCGMDAPLPPSLLHCLSVNILSDWRCILIHLLCIWIKYQEKYVVLQLQVHNAMCRSDQVPRACFRGCSLCIFFFKLEGKIDLLQDKSGSKLTLQQASSRQIAPSSSSGQSASASAVNVASAVPLVNFALQCAMNGDTEKLIQCFEDASDPYHESIGIQINQRSPDDGRTPLDWAALLGHVSAVAELVKRGADVNAVTEKGVELYCVESCM